MFSMKIPVVVGFPPTDVVVVLVSTVEVFAGAMLSDIGPSLVFEIVVAVCSLVEIFDSAGVVETDD